MASARSPQKVVRIPDDMAPLIRAEAKAQGVSENTWLVAVIAGALGYKLPEK